MFVVSVVMVGSVLRHFVAKYECGGDSFQLYEANKEDFTHMISSYPDYDRVEVITNSCHK